MVTQARAGQVPSARDLEEVSMALAGVVLNGDMNQDSFFSGIQAFLMALETSGQVDAYTIKERLIQMASYFNDIKNIA